MEPANGVLFVFTVAALGALATGGALIRTRREAAGGARERARRRQRGAGRPRRPRRAPARRRGGRRHAWPTAARSRSTTPGPPAPGEVVAPLLARGEQLGTLTLAARRELGADDRVLAAELAQRCAAAVDSARLLAEADEAYGMLDAVFARAPVGLALYDRDLRLVRINDHLAEINGLPAAEQIGRPVSPRSSRTSRAWSRACARCSRPVAACRSSRSRARRARHPACGASSRSPTGPSAAAATTRSSASAAWSPRSPSAAPPTAPCASRPRATSRCCARSPRSARA